MKCIDRIRRGFAGALVLPLALLGGCMEYEVETQLNADGSGMRSERLVLDETDDSDLALRPEAFKGLMHVREKDGWSYKKEADEDGDEINVFTRRTPIRGWQTWSELSRRIHIAAAAGARAGFRAGDPEYADVGFYNAVQVESGQGAEGRTITFRERFYWENLAGVLVDYELRGFRQSLQRRYPQLAPDRRGELVGLARGAVWATAQQGRWDMSESERVSTFAPLVEHLSAEAARIVDARQPAASEDFFAAEFQRLLMEEEDEEEFESVLEQKLPGAVLAGNTLLVVRLKMPGRVLEANAHERDDGTLVWEFSPWEAVIVPVEVYAESRVDE